MTDQLKFVCGTCNVDPEVVTDADGNAEAVCPGCGQRDKVEDVQRIGSEHFFESSGPDVMKGIGDASKGEFTKFEAKRVPKRRHRWHAVQV